MGLGQWTPPATYLAYCCTKKSEKQMAGAVPLRDPNIIYVPGGKATCAILKNRGLQKELSGFKTPQRR